ncbi:unnamed protein product [marine sediment metagenome]|uniref:Uncharacterized protein n=1 Tax=marine sediment metagenome TaxID=412755 RepID=X1TXR8_9ZZZZ
MFIKNEDIVGYIDIGYNHETVCEKCLSEEEEKTVLEANIITADEAEKSDGSYFCDRCKEKIY